MNLKTKHPESLGFSKVKKLVASRCYSKMLVVNSTGKTRRWHLKSFLFFTPKIGEMIQFDYIIFFNWVGSTTK